MSHSLAFSRAEIHPVENWYFTLGKSSCSRHVASDASDIFHAPVQCPGGALTCLEMQWWNLPTSRNLPISNSQRVHCSCEARQLALTDVAEVSIVDARVWCMGADRAYWCCGAGQGGGGLCAVGAAGSGREPDL